MSARRPEEPAQSNAADAAADADMPEPSVQEPPAKRARGTALDSARTAVAALLFRVEKLEAEIERDEALQDTSSKIKARLAKGQSKMPDLKAKLAAARKKMLDLEGFAAAKKKEATTTSRSWSRSRCRSCCITCARDVARCFLMTL